VRADRGAGAQGVLVAEALFGEDLGDAVFGHLCCEFHLMKHSQRLAHGNLLRP